MGNGRAVLQASLVGILGVAVLGSTLRIAGENRRDNADYEFLDPIIDVHQLIRNSFQGEVDAKKLQDGAITGMVEALNDPYTVYVPASDTGEFTKQLTGEYVGIGAQVLIQEKWLTIVSPLEDSPAFRAGLMADDRVVEIEGESTYGLAVDKCVEKLMGQPGTKVRFVVERKGEKIPFEITRERIKTRSVKGFHRVDADGNRWMYMIDPARSIAYVRLTQFTPKCAEEVLAALRGVGAEEGKLKGLVLDLRYNPGGELQDAIDIADLFLRDGVIVSTKGRKHDEEIARARGEGTLPDFPIALLLNGQSASASEVLAGALTENARAIVVGTRSFGKGTVQTVRRLPRGKGAELKITEQGYYLPSGRSITRQDDAPTWGVDPTDGFFVPMTDDEVTQMFEVRRTLEVLHHAKESAGEAPQDAGAVPAADWTSAEGVLDALKDKQLTAAVLAVQQRIETGEWKPTGAKTEGGKSVGQAELHNAEELRKRLERELDRVDRRIAALEAAVGEGGDAAPPDLWPDNVKVKGGKITVYDKSGVLVAELAITGEDVERWLADAQVKRVGALPETGAAKPEASEPKK